MAKEVEAMRLREGAEGFRKGFNQLRQAAPCRMTQGGLEFCKSHFDGVEIRAVGGQIQDVATRSGNSLLNAFDLVAGQVVTDDDIADSQFGAKDLLDVCEKGIPIHGSIQKHGSTDTIASQGGNEGSRLPMTMRNLGKTAFPSKAAAIKTAHFGVEPCLINKDQATDIPVLAALLPGLPRRDNVGSILLGGA